MTVAMTPIACSVNVETASPIPPSAASAASAAATYKLTNSSRIGAVVGEHA
jgi:hypothetical protein